MDRAPGMNRTGTWCVKAPRKLGVSSLGGPVRKPMLLGCFGSSSARRATSGLSFTSTARESDSACAPPLICAIPTSGAGLPQAFPDVDTFLKGMKLKVPRYDDAMFQARLV